MAIWHQYAGRFDEEWQVTRAPCLPRDFRPDYWQSAPPDQQISRKSLRAAVFEVGAVETTGPTDQPSRFPLTDLDLACATRIKGRWTAAPAELQTIRGDVTQRRLDLVYLARWEVPRANSDIEFDLSKLALNSTAGFRVRAEDSHLFSASAREVMSLVLQSRLMA